MKRNYKTLVAADIYRDGGSIEVRFACTDGVFETLWLKVADNHEGIFVHTDLVVAVDPLPDLIILKDSPEEDALLAALNRFLHRPKVEIPFARRTDEPGYLDIVEKLIAAIPKREVLSPRSP